MIFLPTLRLPRTTADRDLVKAFAFGGKSKLEISILGTGGNPYRAHIIPATRLQLNIFHSNTLGKVRYPQHILSKTDATYAMFPHQVKQAYTTPLTVRMMVWYGLFSVLCIICYK